MSAASPALVLVLGVQSISASAELSATSEPRTAGRFRHVRAPAERLSAPGSAPEQASAPAKTMAHGHDHLAHGQRVWIGHDERALQLIRRIEDLGHGFHQIVESEQRTLGFEARERQRMGERASSARRAILPCTPGP
jgi:hypothetical protein